MVSSKLMKRYFSFSTTEKKELLVTTIIFSFILFFFAWNTTNYTIISGILDFIQFFIISSLSMYIFVSSVKWFAVQRHYTAEYKAWISAALIGFFISFISYGYLPILFPGLIEVKRIERLRHGKVFSGENKYDIFTILAIAPISAIILSIFSQLIYQLTTISFFYYLMVFNATLVFFSLLPLTKNIGSHLFYTNKTQYFFLLLFSFGFFILTIFNVYGSAVIAAMLAIILWYILKSKMSKVYGMG
jgi:hypothetical protein